MTAAPRPFTDARPFTRQLPRPRARQRRASTRRPTIRCGSVRACRTSRSASSPVDPPPGWSNTSRRTRARGRRRRPGVARRRRRSPTASRAATPIVRRRRPRRGATTWYFAEGYTGTGFDEYLTHPEPERPGRSGRDHLLPQRRRAGRQEPHRPGQRPLHRRRPRRGRGRRAGQGGSAKVESTNGVGIVVERPMYFTYRRRRSPAATTSWASRRRARAGCSPRATPGRASTST